ncbi:hypothetical protein Cni_G06710 [Canna indica]|uniref:Exopolygalacturonase n=1 Tax=Canna indica TaxID=4628 RepID=A0AAQ3Q6N9_9LILI|nr:hypothetical protein Cni_G06710 [Canna indica]
MASEPKFMVIGFLFLILKAASAQQLGVYNVKAYGASGYGQIDSTKAFQDAWNASCATAGKPRIVIPEGKYLVGPLVFKGPCKGMQVIELRGELLASTDLSIYVSNWIQFQYIDGLIITGNGRFNGQGATAWPHNQCPKKWSCKLLPTSLVFSYVTNATIMGVTLLDPKLFHMQVFKSNYVTFNSIRVTAPGDSPNTDGLHIAESSNIVVNKAVIATGDDCISIGPGNRNLSITGVTCGPGHGISVGSLGKTPGENDVVGLTVRNCTFIGTSNGLRIKSWQSSVSALKASGFHYEDIVMKDVYNPIIIDQEYCPYVSCPEKDPSLVKITDVTFKNIRGTSLSEEAIKLVCSASNPCEGVQLQDIHFEYTGDKPNISLTSTCVNAQGFSNGNVNPNSCV